MKAIPILRCLDMKKALTFYTDILDFTLKYQEATAEDWVVELVNGDAELLITRLEGDQRPFVNVYIQAEDVDALFQKYLDRGLDISNKSGVHGGPLDQTWGMREFYVDDPEGNTLRFGQPIRLAENP